MTATGQGTAAVGTAEVLEAILDLAGDLDLPSLLERFVGTSVSLTRARYGAINIVDELGVSTTFVQTGVDAGTAASLGHPPHARGVLGHIPDEGVLRLEDLTHHASFRGLPPGHPPMGSFLGAAVRVRGERYGTLYLSEKHGGFDDDDERVVLALAAGAAVAIQNAQLYEIERRRERWLTAAQGITTMLLEGADQEEVLEQVATTARHIGGADTCALVLPGRDGELLMEIVSGPGERDLLGVDLSDDPLVRTAFADGDGQVVTSLVRHDARHPSLAGYGPALLIPMSTSGHSVGVMLLLRPVRARPFTPSDLALSRTFASQAALGFVLAQARQAQARSELHDERSRIARDLHDLAIQQLFAAGMDLESAATGELALPPAGGRLVRSAQGHIEAGVRQIRVIVRALDDPGAAIPLSARVRAELELARSSLPFAPSLDVVLDDRTVDLDADAGAALRLDELVSAARADNVVAVVREGLTNVARHAQATAAGIRLVVRTSPQGSLEVEVRDDGVGVPEHLTRASGTRNLAARAAGDGGTFTLGRGPGGRGTVARWTTPLTP